MADAVEKGADCIITIGGIQSNHCRATAVAAKYLNLDSYLILRTSKVNFILNKYTSFVTLVKFFLSLRHACKCRTGSCGPRSWTHREPSS